MADDDDWRRTWLGLLPLYLHAPVEPAALADIDARTRYSAAAWQYAITRCLGSFNTLPRLGEIRAPTLILGGAHDAPTLSRGGAHDVITPVPHGAERLRAGIPGSELVVFNESGHFPFIEEPEAFTDVVRGWLSRLPGSAG
jgi:proline iminopeptidase